MVDTMEENTGNSIAKDDDANISKADFDDHVLPKSVSTRI